MITRTLFACLVGSAVSLLPSKALAATIDFETLPDSSDVGAYYHALYGLDFQSAIALTAGLSLNELDFPPHSGSIVVGDNVANDGDPMILRFVNPVSSLSGYFAYGSQLTFSAYDHNGALIGTYVTPTSSNLGSDLLISLPFPDIGQLNIAGQLRIPLSWMT